MAFQFSETMSGTWRPAAGGTDKAIAFSITARAGSSFQYLRDRKTGLQGRLRMEGFAADVPIEGELLVDPLFGKRIRYTFNFTGDDGRRYRFAGQKDVRFTDLARTMTTLPAEIFDERGGAVASCQMRFDKRDLPSFLASFRPF
jgi:hypothetical protein